MAHIVLVEGEPELSALVPQALQEVGHTVEPYFDGETALKRLVASGATDPDLLALDLMLPKVDGLEICRRIRQNKIVPVLMLTAKSTELDRVLGLELGADDYLTKPVSLRELQAWVSAILPGAVVKASMSDTGIGIPPEELDRVFDRFYQVEHEGRKTGGSGLGLSIVKQIVEAQDGTVTVESHPGQGTTFRFSLPVAAP
jgi:DNA-binding response OmpR family regulator